MSSPLDSRTSGSIGVHSNGDADPTLYAKKFLPYGYGSGGAAPLHFQPCAGNINVTILKFYFTTSPVDLKWVEQPTPFDEHRGNEDFLSSSAVSKMLLCAPEDIGFTKSLKIELITLAL